MHGFERAPEALRLENSLDNSGLASNAMTHDLHITFLHANGYPSGVYRRFFSALREGAEVDAPDILATADDCAPRMRWPNMLDQAIAAARAAITADANASKRLVLVGHSMGGYLALQAASEIGERISGVVLIDSPIPTGWRAALLSFSQVTGMAYKAGPAPIAARRRDSWPTREKAREFFAGKPFVQQWAGEVLDDFVAHGLVDHDDSARLRIPRDSERDIYAEIVHTRALRALRVLRRRGTPVSFIAGERSDETRMAGRAQNRRLFAPNFHELPYGHLIPMEAPEVCAAEVLRVLREDRIDGVTE